MEEDQFKDTEVDFWDAASTFDKKIAIVIAYWRNALEEPGVELLVSLKENDELVKKVVEQIEKAMTIFATKKVNAGSLKRKRDDGYDTDDSWGASMERQISAVHREYEEGGRIARPS